MIKAKKAIIVNIITNPYNNFTGPLIQAFKSIAQSIETKKGKIRHNSS